MEYRKLGKTDISVSTVAMGCWAIAGDATWGDQDEGESIATVEAAIDAGINFFDTAEAYGNGYSEEVLGKVLPAHREKVVIASKFGSGYKSGAAIRAACETSLKRLQTDYIDYYQFHWPPPSELSFEVAMETLEALKAEGKIRSIGAGNFGVQNLADFWKVGHAEGNQIAYNILFRAVEYEIQPQCVAHQMGLICYSPMGQGLMTGKFRSADDVPEGRARTRLFSKDRPQAKHGEAGAEAEVFEAIDRIREICDDLGKPMVDVALAWVIHQPGVTSVLAGTRSVAQAKENALAGDLSLSEDVLAALNQATDPVKEKLGSNPDMWMPEPRMQ